MKKSIIIKSLINGIASCFAVALVQSLIRGIPFVQALTAPYTILLAISAAVGSFIGYEIRAARQ